MSTSEKDVKDKWYPSFVDGLPSASGKTVAITGTTSGTGFAAAKAVLRKGGRVLLLNRPSQRADDALQRLRALADNPDDAVAVECDLQEFASVRRAAEEVKRIVGTSGLDVLVNNAGIMAQHDKPTKDGYEQQMQTNHLSHFLLTSLLMSSLEKAVAARGQARIVNHSSAARQLPATPLADTFFKKGESFGGDSFGARSKRYQQSKLANVVFTLALQDKLSERESGVFALVAHPGGSATSLMDSMNSTFGGGWASYILGWLKRMVAGTLQSGADGAMPLLHCALAQEVQPGSLYGPSIKGMMGILSNDYMKGLPRRSELEAVCTKPESQDLLWRASEDACGHFFA